MSTDRKLWLDTRGVPVITTSPNGERNARRWGWTPAVAVPVDKALDPDRGVETGYALQVDALTRERDQLQGRVLYLEKMDAAKEARLAHLTKDQEQRIDALRESYGERVRDANARADAAEAKVRELERAGDPVEALAEELYDADHEDDFAYTLWKHHNLKDDKDRYRRMARRVIERKDEDR